MAGPKLEAVRQGNTRLAYVKGHLVVVGDYIDGLAYAVLAEASHAVEPDHNFSITIATADELLELQSSAANYLTQEMSEDSLKGIVTLDIHLHHGLYSLAIVWKTGDEIRREIGLAPQLLHIDLCREGKEPDLRLRSFLGPRPLAPQAVILLVDYCKISAQYPHPSPDLWLRISGHMLQEETAEAEMLDLLAVMMHKTRNFDSGLRVSNFLISRFPSDPRGYFRAAAYISHGGKVSASTAPGYTWKLAMMLYGEALSKALILQTETGSRNQSFVDKVCTQSVQAILHCARHTEFGCVATEAEIADLPQEFLELMIPWSSQVRSAVLRAFVASGQPDPSTLLSLDSRTRMCVYSTKHKQFRKLPRFFRWITPFRIAVMSTPRNADDIKVLEDLGIHNVVTLTKEEPLKQEWFLATKVTNVFMPVDNYKAPTVAQIDNFFNIFENSSPQTATLVHCGGGKGRAGTFVACYLARYGFTGTPDALPIYSSANEVTTIVRQMRPGSIETEEQEQFICRFVKELWKRAETGGRLVLIPEPEVAEPVLEIQGMFNPKCKLIVCCGIPGSGKSSVSSALAQQAEWEVACQDECGSWDACAQVVFSAMRQGRPVIVDRCNPTIKDRQEWVDMTLLPPSQTLCLFFDYDKALCLQRANQRVNHPTLEAGRARNAVHSMHKSLQCPSLAEKFGAVVTIRSISVAKKFTEYFTRPESKGKEQVSSTSGSTLRLTNFHKFPRTRHLMNFGSATRDDLVMTSCEAAAFVQSRVDGADQVIVTFEEKVDGANIGLSIDPDTGQVRAQNRSHFVTNKTHPQFKKLDFWISNHLQDLMALLIPRREGADAMPGRYILFGEWLHATHSIRYTRLPDYFLAFDVYDSMEDKFWSREKFDSFLEKSSIHRVPRIPVPQMSEGVFQQLMNQTSQFYDGPVEGVYVRRDVGPFLLDRAKVVRKDFISGNVHWSKQDCSENIIRLF